MKTNPFKFILFTVSVLLSVLILLNACSKAGNSPSSTTTTTPTPTDPCAGKTITISGSATSADVCTGAKVSISASGSTNFTYSIDGGSFGLSSDFSGVSIGDHTITVKDGAGCSQSAKVTVTAVAAGPFYAAVKALIQAQCISCHSGATASAGRDWSNDCQVITNKNLIKQRTIDGTPSFMPQGGQLSVSDKKIITDWINAGGRYSD